MAWKKIFEFNKKYWWFFPLVVFLIWRVMVEIFGHLFLISAVNPLTGKANLPIWVRWDSLWYASIVTKGYSYIPGVQSNVAFFPVYPLLWKFFSLFFKGNIFWSALFVSNFFAAGFTLVFYKLALNILKEKNARRALLAMLVFPTSVFLVAAYSESVFLFFLALSAYFASKDEYKKAALAALILSACRVTGILWWPALLFFWYLKNKKIIWDSNFLTLLILPPLGLAAYSCYLFFTVGDPLAFLHVQSAWMRKFVWPHQLLLGYAYYIYLKGEMMIYRLVELVSLIFASILIFRIYKLDRAYALFGFLCLLPSLFSGTLNSLERYIFCIPFMFLALAKEKYYWFFLYCSISFVLFVTQIIRFVNFAWAG